MSEVASPNPRSEEAQGYLRDLFAKASVNVSWANMEDGRPRAVMKLDVPIGAPLYVTAHIQGASLRFIAHQVVAGEPTAQSQENCRQVNLAPWAGRVYPAADQSGTDISIGVPLAKDRRTSLLVEAFIRLIFESAMQLREIKMPDYLGPALADARQFEAAIAEFFSKAYPNSFTAHDGKVLVADTASAAGHDLRVEMFLLDARLVVARAHLAYDVDNNVQANLAEKLTRINQAAAAGAIAWDTQTRHLSSQVVLYPALMQVQEGELQWMVDAAMKLVDAALA